MPPTRGSLHIVRRQIGLAKRGHELLKRKQDALILEFFKLLKLVQRERSLLHKEYVRAAQMLAQARALESDLRIKSASLAVQEAAPLRLTIRNVAGVRLPEIERLQENAAPIYDSLLLQDVGMAYNAVARRVVSVAARETALRKVLLEINRVKRRTKALSDVVIPRLETDRQRILLGLDEREREDFLRRKLHVVAQ